MSLRVRPSASLMRRVAAWHPLSMLRAGFLLVSVLLLILVYLFWSVPSVGMPKITASAKYTPAKGDQQVSDAHSHQHAAQDRVEALSVAASSVSLLDASALHFSAPAMAAPELYAGGSTQVLLDSSCSA